MLQDRPIARLRRLSRRVRGTQVMEVFNHISKEEHKTILLSVHQPSSHVYKLFDKLTLLAPGECGCRDQQRRAVCAAECARTYARGRVSEDLYSCASLYDQNSKRSNALWLCRCLPIRADLAVAACPNTRMGGK